MTLGETIRTIRLEKEMSQGDLADALDVSRQSVSKWETDASVPELDKLIGMCELFGVTMDELVRGIKPAEPAPAEEIPAEEPTPPTTELPEASIPQKPPHTTAGVILLCTGAVITLLLTVLGSLLGGLLYASPFLLCGLICLFCRNRVGLKCGWAVYFTLDLFMNTSTGVNRSVIFRTFIYHPSDNYMILLLSWIMVFLLLALIGWTIYAYRKTAFTGIRQIIPVAILLIFSLVLSFIAQFLTYQLIGDIPHTVYRTIGQIISTISFLSAWLKIAAYTTVLCILVPWLLDKGKKRRESRQK